jgi:hypothetical protein
MRLTEEYAITDCRMLRFARTRVMIVSSRAPTPGASAYPEGGLAHGLNQVSFWDYAFSNM